MPQLDPGRSRPHASRVHNAAPRSAPRGSTTDIPPSAPPLRSARSSDCEIVIVHRGTRDEPGVGIRSRQHPALPQTTRIGLRRRVLHPGIGLRWQPAPPRALRSCDSRRNTGRRSARTRLARTGDGTHSRWFGLPNSAHTIMRDAMSAVTILASIAVELTSGAVRNARNRELLVDLALVLAIQLLPLQIARRGHIRNIARRAVRVRLLFQAHREILGVVVAPIEAFGAAKPVVLGTAI